jgi:SAM-dependent methyltransferase
VVDASEWDERYRAADRLWSAEPNLFVADRLAHAKPGTGVDLAGGEGRNGIWLASLGWTMTIVDFSEAAIERGRNRAPDVEFVVADVLDWEPGRPVDLVLIAYLHLQADQFASVVGRSQEWLAPGGELFMIGHDRANPEEGYGGPQNPEILWDVDEVVDLIEGEIVESLVVRRPVETPDGTVYALDTLVRARLA